MTLKQAYSSEYQGVQGAFKDSMIHWILQFTLLIAFRCVLHRCESQEIRCWKLYLFASSKRRSMTVVWCKKRRQRSPSLSNLDQYLPQRCKGVCWIGKSVHMPRKASYNPVQFINDPSAGSPTETLLRLLLPLNDQVWSTSQQQGAVAGSPKPIRRPH